MSQEEHSGEGQMLFTMPDEGSVREAFKVTEPLFKLELSQPENRFEMKELCGNTREGRRKVKEWNQLNDTFLDKINIMLDLHIVQFEVNFFKCLYFAVSILLLSIIMYNRYLGLYINDQKTTAYHDFASSTQESIKSETLSSSHQFLGNLEFTRQCLTHDDFMKYNLIRHKFKNNTEVLSSLSSWRLQKVQSYLVKFAMIEVDRIFEGDQDWNVILLFDWLVVGFVLHQLRNKLMKNYIHSQIEKLISVENRTIFYKKNRAWVISKDLKVLKYYRLPGSEGEDGDELDTLPEHYQNTEEAMENHDCESDVDKSEDDEMSPGPESTASVSDGQIPPCEAIELEKVPSAQITSKKSSHSDSPNANPGKLKASTTIIKCLINKFGTTKGQAIEQNSPCSSSKSKKNTKKDNEIDQSLNESEIRDLDASNMI